MFNIRLSQKTKTNVLLLIVAALSVSYIMNKQITAVLSLLLLSGVAYMLSKNIIISLALSIIITNLLLSLNYFVVEGLEGNTKAKAKAKAQAKAQPEDLAKGVMGPPKDTRQKIKTIVENDNENNKRYGSHQE